MDLDVCHATTQRQHKMSHAFRCAQRGDLVGLQQCLPLPWHEFPHAVQHNDTFFDDDARRQCGHFVPVDVLVIAATNDFACCVALLLQDSITSFHLGLRRLRSPTELTPSGQQQQQQQPQQPQQHQHQLLLLHHIDQNSHGSHISRIHGAIHAAVRYGSNQVLQLVLQFVGIQTHKALAPTTVSAISAVPAVSSVSLVDYSVDGDIVANQMTANQMAANQMTANQMADSHWMHLANLRTALYHRQTATVAHLLRHCRIHRVTKTPNKEHADTPNKEHVDLQHCATLRVLKESKDECREMYMDVLFCAGGDVRSGACLRRTVAKTLRLLAHAKAQVDTLEVETLDRVETPSLTQSLMPSQKPIIKPRIHNMVHVVHTPLREAVCSGIACAVQTLLRILSDQREQTQEAQTQEAQTESTCETAQVQTKPMTRVDSLCCRCVRCRHGTLLHVALRAQCVCCTRHWKLRNVNQVNPNQINSNHVNSNQVNRNKVTCSGCDGCRAITTKLDSSLVKGCKKTESTKCVATCVGTCDATQTHAQTHTHNWCRGCTDRVRIVRLLLQHKANANGCGCDDAVSPLQLARQRGGPHALELEQLLLSFGAHNDVED